MVLGYDSMNHTERENYYKGVDSTNFALRCGFVARKGWIPYVEANQVEKRKFGSSCRMDLI